MQISTTLTPLRDANPAMDPIVDAQARFRLDGAGPVASRRPVPITAGARELLAREPEAVAGALAGVQRLVEDAAGGASASRSVQLDGIALAFDARGHGANTYRAKLDGDPILHADIARFSGDERARQLALLGEATMRTDASTKATVTGGWMNVGPETTRALLAPTTDASAAAMAVRILAHETEHVVDGSDPPWNSRAGAALRELTAEAHATRLPALTHARDVLGWSGVDDAALQATLGFRPYARLEQGMGEVLRLGGVEPGSREAAALLSLPSKQLAAQLEQRIAAASKAPPAQVRETLQHTFDGLLSASR